MYLSVNWRLCKGAATLFMEIHMTLSSRSLYCNLTILYYQLINLQSFCPVPFATTTVGLWCMLNHLHPRILIQTNFARNYNKYIHITMANEDIVILSSKRKYVNFISYNNVIYILIYIYDVIFTCVWVIRYVKDRIGCFITAIMPDACWVGNCCRNGQFCVQPWITMHSVSEGHFCAEAGIFASNKWYNDGHGLILQIELLQGQK